EAARDPDVMLCVRTSNREQQCQQSDACGIPHDSGRRLRTEESTCTDRDDEEQRRPCPIVKANVDCADVRINSAERRDDEPTREEGRRRRVEQRRRQPTTCPTSVG